MDAQCLVQVFQQKNESILLLLKNVLLKAILFTIGFHQ